MPGGPRQHNTHDAAADAQAICTRACAALGKLQPARPASRGLCAALLARLSCHPWIAAFSQVSARAAVARISLKICPFL